MIVRKLSKYYRIAIVLIVILTILVSMAGIYSFADNEENGVEEKAAVTADADLIQDMQLVAEDGSIALYVDMATSDFYILDKKTGKRYYSSQQESENDPVANNFIKNNMRSILSIDYYNIRNAVASMNTFADSLPYKQVEVTKIDGGVRSVFTIGQKDTRRVIVRAMRKEQFEALMEKLSDDEKVNVMASYKLYTHESVLSIPQKEELLKAYPTITEYDLYILRPDQGERKLKQLEQVFTRLGLTVDSIDEENELIGVNVENEVKPVFTVPVTLRVEDGDFIAEVDTREISIPENYILHRIVFLEYFGAASKDENGYFLVPDGSGALISFNSNAASRSYAQNLYGNDNAILLKERTFYGQNAVLPVFGARYSKGGMFAVIESGEALARINANISGHVSSYNNVFASFTVSPSSFMSYNKAMRDEGIYLFPRDISRTPIRIRYTFLDDNNNSYTGMARYLRHYYEKLGYISQLKDTNPNVPFYVEMQGSIEKRKAFFGIAYDSMQPLTTFEQAGEIYDRIIDSGIGNVYIRYTGWSNGGYYNYHNRNVNVQKELGGKNELKKLAEQLKQKGGRLYLDTDFLYVGREKLFDSFSPSKDASRFLDRKIATVFSYDLASYFIKTDSSYGKYVLSPKNLLGNITAYLSDYNSLGLGTISAGTMGSNLNSDYNRRNTIDRNYAQSILREGLSRLRVKNAQVMVNSGNGYVLPYVSDILEIPLTSSYLKVQSESVPFYQIVIHGYVRYAGEALNTTLNTRHMLLKSVETGAGLHYKWMYETDDVFSNTKYMYSKYSLHYANWLNDAADIYRKVNSALKGTQDALIEDHIRVEENVYKTVFSNGLAVAVNYNRYPVKVDGISIDAEDFEVVGGMN